MDRSTKSSLFWKLLSNLPLGSAPLPLEPNASCRRLFDAYISTFHMLMKSSHEKTIIFVSCVKMINFDAKNGFSRNLSCIHITSRCTHQIFIRFFFTYSKSFIRWQEHLLPCSKVNSILVLKDLASYALHPFVKETNGTVTQERADAEDLPQ